MGQILVHKKASATFHMGVDRTLVMSPIDEPLLRFYEWERFCVTAGLFTDTQHLTMHGDVEVARRPTGGGVLFHENDMAFSILYPKTHRLYQRSTLDCCREINEMIMHGLSSWLPMKWYSQAFVGTERSLFCMSNATDFDIVWQRKKVGGCAQRKTKHGLLHQTSLFVRDPNWEAISGQLSQKKDVEMMKATVSSLETLLSEVVEKKSLQIAIGNSFLERI